jgi:hypothetical protein
MKCPFWISEATLIILHNSKFSQQWSWIVLFYNTMGSAECKSFSELHCTFNRLNDTLSQKIELIIYPNVVFLWLSSVPTTEYLNWATSSSFQIISKLSFFCHPIYHTTLCNLATNSGVEFSPTTRFLLATFTVWFMVNLWMHSVEKWILNIMIYHCNTFCIITKTYYFYYP